jgi:hypothetical protein
LGILDVPKYNFPFVLVFCIYESLATSPYNFKLLEIILPETSNVFVLVVLPVSLRLPSIITLLDGCVFCIYLIYMFNNFEYTTIENNNLQWKWTKDPTNVLYIYYAIAFIILGYENLHAPKNIGFVLLTIASIAFGIYYKNEGVGRYWCKFGAYAPLAFIPIILNNN